MILRFLISIFLCGLEIVCQAQIDHVGSGRALKFTADDQYVNLGNIFDDLDLPLAISAWVKLDPGVSSACPIFASQENQDLYNGIQLFIQSNAIIFEYGDGQGNNSPSYRKGKIASFGNVDMNGRWMNICGVMYSKTNIQLYINGIDIGGDYSGDSELPMASNYPGDVAKIGTYLSNGTKYRFQGEIDEVRVWNRGLTVGEVRQNMCRKLIGNEAGLIGYWTFDETSGTTIVDHSQNGFDGQLVGSPQRVFSGAPLGDVSKSSYPPPIASVPFTMNDGSLSVKTLNFLGNPEGIQIYEVKDKPSRTAGLPPGNSDNPYFGVYLASLRSNRKCDVTLLQGGVEDCNAFQRLDNSTDPWTNVSLPVLGNLDRSEFVWGTPVPFPSLGQDQILCDASSFVINSGINASQNPLLWSTGETTASITVHTSGAYAVSLLNCNRKDTVAIFFATSPEPAKLGNDISECIFNPLVLRPTVDTLNYAFLWQDGSTKATFAPSGFGTYWVSVKNYCGTDRDSITIAQKPHPDINLGNDQIVCDQSSYTINSGLDISQNPVKWSNGEMGSAITIHDSGSYSVALVNCSEIADTLAIFFTHSPELPNLGEDISQCAFLPLVLRATLDTVNYSFLWQDGSTNATYKPSNFGTYWVVVQNYCGIKRDSILISEKPRPDFSKVPNVITPNEDEWNQFFVVETDPQSPIELVVINRWGKEVYRSNSYQNDWSGNDLSAGTYYLKMTSACINYKNWLTIIK